MAFSIETPVDTILNYIEYINNSMIASKVSRYNIRGKSVMTLLEKYYLVDLGLLQLKNSPIEKKVGERFYIQVADYLSSDEVVEREFGAYKNVADNFPNM